MKHAERPYCILKLKFKKIKGTSLKKPIAVEKLKNEDVADKYKLNLHNRFQVLQGLRSNVEEQWRPNGHRSSEGRP